MGGDYDTGPKASQRPQQVRAGPPAVAVADSAIPPQGWLAWMQMQLLAAMAATYRGFVGKGDARQYRVLHSVARQSLYRLLTALFGTVVDAAILPGVGTLLQILEEDRHQRRDHHARGFQRVKAALEHFAHLPSGTENEKVLRELQDMVKVVLPGLDLLDDYRSGAFTERKFDLCLEAFGLALATPTLIKSTEGASLQLAEGVKDFRLLCTRVVLAHHTTAPEALVAVVANDGFMRAMVPSELHWVFDTIAELAAIIGAFRPLLAGPGAWHRKALQLLELILKSRLGSLLLPSLESMLRPAIDLFDYEAQQTGDEDLAALAQGDPAAKTLEILQWLALQDRSLAATGWMPEWLTAVFSYLDTLVDGCALFVATPAFPARPVEQLTWGIELLQQPAIRRLLDTLFTSSAIQGLTMPFALFDEVEPLPEGSSHTARSAWASSLVGRPDLTAYLAAAGASAEDIGSLREALAWGPVVARLSSAADRLGGDAGYLQTARTLFVELGGLLYEQMTLPGLTTTARVARRLALSTGDPAAATVLGAYIALREMDARSGYADGLALLVESVQANLETLTGEEQPTFREHEWLFNAARQGVSIAWRWWHGPSAAEVESLLEKTIRVVKVVFDLSPQTHAALDAIPLIPMALDAFDASAADSGFAPLARLDRFAQALQDSAHPGVKKLGQQAERWLVNGVVDAMGALLPQHRSLGESMPAAAALDAGTVDTALVMQSADWGMVPRHSAGWHSEQIHMGGNVLSFIALMTMLYGGYSFWLQRREAGYAQVQTAADAEGQHPGTDRPGILTRYRTAGLALAGSLVTASLAAGTYAWSERRRREEQRQAALDEPMTAVVPGARITLLGAVQNFLIKDSGNAQVARDPEAVTASLHKLLDGSADEEGTQVEVGPARIRVRRNADNGHEVVPYTDTPQPGDEVRELSVDPLQGIENFKLDIAVNAYFEDEIDNAMRRRVEESAELPPRLTSIESFAEEAGAAIKSKEFFRPPGYSGGELLNLEYRSYEENPAQYFFSPLVQPYVAVHTFFSPNDASTLPNSRPFWRRFLFNMQGEVSVPAVELITGHLTKIIGENTYAINAADPLQQAYFKALTSSTVVRDYEAEVASHLANHKPQMKARLEARIHKHLDRAVGRTDYHPRERLASHQATLRPVHAQPVEAYPSQDKKFPGESEHPLLDTLRYVDPQERIDIILFMTTGLVYDAYAAERSIDRGADSDANRSNGQPVSTDRFEVIVEVLRNTANMKTEVFNSIAQHISPAELGYARMLRNDQGQLVYAPDFIRRVEALQPHSLVEPYVYPGPLELKSQVGMTVADFAQWQLTVLHRDLLYAADARSVSPEEQETAWWTHKFELVGNLVATGLTILGAVPFAAATQFARAAWLAAVTSASISAIRRTGTAETETERKDLLKRWFMTIGTETFFWLLGEFAVDGVAKEILPPRLPSRRTFGKDDFLVHNPAFTSPEYARRLFDSFGIFSGADVIKAGNELRVEAYRTKIRERIKTAINQGLLHSALHLSAYVQTALDQTDFSMIGTPQLAAKELPLQYRERLAGSAGAGRYLPRDTLPAVDQRSVSSEWTVDEAGLPGAAPFMFYAEDSDENQWGRTLELDPHMPGRYRNTGEHTYRYLGSNPAHFYGGEKVRLVWRKPAWQVIPIVLTDLQIEEARRAWEARAPEPQPTTLRPESALDARPSLGWVVSADASGRLHMSQPETLPDTTGPNRWKAHDNDDPREPGVFRRLGEPPTFNNGKTYEYLGELDDRSQQQLFALKETNGKWTADSAPLPDRSYNPASDLNALRESSGRVDTQLIRLQYNQKELERMSPHLPTWLEKVSEINERARQIELKIAGDSELDLRLRVFAKGQLKPVLLLGLLDTWQRLREQRQVETAKIVAATQQKVAQLASLKAHWRQLGKIKLLNTAFSHWSLSNTEKKLRAALQHLREHPPRVTLHGVEYYVWQQHLNTVQDKIDANMEAQRLVKLNHDQIWMGNGDLVDPLPLIPPPEFHDKPSTAKPPPAVTPPKAKPAPAVTPPAARPAPPVNPLPPLEEHRDNDIVEPG